MAHIKIIRNTASTLRRGKEDGSFPGFVSNAEGRMVGGRGGVTGEGSVGTEPYPSLVEVVVPEGSMG